MKTNILLSVLAATAGLAQVAAGMTYDREPQPADYTAHEWGTFTSVASSDGTLLPWNPFTVSDLPSFVYTRTAPLRGPEFAGELVKFILSGGKATSHWLQRMETPVIYFHADESLTVSATVDFPKGLVTEWFPQVAAFGPANGAAPLIPNTARSFVHWDNVKIMPKSAHPAAPVPRVEARRVDPMSMTVLPHQPSQPSHYTRARGTSANPLEVRSPLMTAMDRRDGQDEEFLFYRGAGNFGTPLKVSFEHRDRVVLQNTGRVALASLHFAEFRNGRARMRLIPSLPAGERVILNLGAPTDTTQVMNVLETSLQSSLVAAGLFEDEAKAMINTWRPDWLGDNGARVLYLLPKQWTDETLPLKLNPRPKSLVRVMVGRAEMISPETERTLSGLLESSPSMDRAQLAELQAGLAMRFSGAAVSRLRAMKLTELTAGLDEEVAKARTAILDAKIQILNSELERASRSLASLDALRGTFGSVVSPNALALPAAGQ